MLQTMILLPAIESGTNVHLIIDAGTRIWINTYIWKYIVCVCVYKESFFFSFFLVKRTKNEVLSKIKCHRNYCPVAIMRVAFF